MINVLVPAAISAVVLGLATTPAALTGALAFLTGALL